MASRNRSLINKLFDEPKEEEHILAGNKPRPREESSLSNFYGGLC